MEISFEMPLAEVIIDFYDRLKTITQGYGSFDYELLDYRPSDLVKLDILVNGEKVDALSMIVHKDKAREWGVRVCDRLKDEIPKQQFKIAIQGAIGGQIISRSTISAFRKDVTAKCYGGDITPETQTPGETAGRQETHEDGGRRGNPPKRLRGGAEDGE